MNEWAYGNAESTAYGWWVVVPLLNRWASLQHISVGLARACGWALADGRVRRAPWGLQYPERVIHYASSADGSRAVVGNYHGKAWDDLATQALEGPRG